MDFPGCARFGSADTNDRCGDRRAKHISAKDRLKASREIKAKTTAPYSQISNQFCDALRQSLYASKVCAYAQGMSLIKAGSEAFKWNIDLGEVARIWQGGCIIRATFLKKIKKAYSQRPDLQNLLVDEEISNDLAQAQTNWRMVISTAVQ